MRVTVIENGDGDWFRCDHCGTVTALDDARSHGDDFTLCPDCSAALVADIKACYHKWEPEPVWDGYGDEGQCCACCGWFVESDLAVTLFPFICDGYVPIEGDAA